MTIAEFIALTAARVRPAREAMDEEIDRGIRASMELQAAHFGELTDAERLNYGLETRGDLDEVIAQSKLFRFGAHQNTHIESMVYALPKLAQNLCQMQWIFMHAPDNCVYVTSDNPMVRINLSSPSDYRGQDGLGFPDVQASFPINAKLCLLMRWKGSSGHAQITEDLVESFNQRTVAFCDREVYSPRRTAWLDEHFENQAPKSTAAA